MCGIAGVIGLRDGGVLIESMTAALFHRGPDGTGHCSRGDLHVGATRLSIIDPASGPQPVYSPIGDACIVFNGEIYNHRELRADLEARGHRFTTHTDTEVVLRLYEEFGDECVTRLSGMFAFAILDRSRVLLARDRWGIKPLYFAWDPSTKALLFASEIKAILRDRRFTLRLDTQALADMLVLSYPAGDRTFFEGVRSLPPGHTLVVTCEDGARASEPVPYHRRDIERLDDMDFDEAVEQLEAVLERAVERHLAADVDVGLTLSGGIDSALLALFAQQQREHPIATFSVADHEAHADIVQARQVAQLTGSRHHTLILGFDDYLDAIPDMVAGEEQPGSLYGVPFYALCRTIGGQLKACLHGEGADELFGGYREYLDRGSRISYIVRRLPLLKKLGVSPSPDAIETMQRLSGSDGFPAYLQRVFDVNMGGALERQHLVPVDKAAMAASVEMRVPYLDDAVVDLVRRLPLRFLVRYDLGIRKYILRRLCLKRFGPACIDVVLREKLGAPAAAVVLLDRFDRMCDEQLPDTYVTRHEFGACFGSKRELLMFDLFLEVFMKYRGDATSVGPVMDFLHARALESARPRSRAPARRPVEAPSPIPAA